MRTPKYRVRSDRNHRAFVEVDGVRVSLPGAAHSAESKDAYRRLVASYLLKHQSTAKPTSFRPEWEIAVSEVAAAWLDHCQTYYAATAHTRSNEYDNCRYVIRPLVALFGDLPVANLTPAEIKELRESLIAGTWKPKAKPWSRAYINGAIAKIKRMLRWGVETGIVSPQVSAVIAAVAPIRRGRTAARETKPIDSVPLATVEATLPYMPPVVAAMVQLQQLTGMRSDNVCSLRPCDLDRSTDVWLYLPAEHKGSHHNKTLAIPIGPRAQAVLAPFLDRPDQPDDAYCFSPREVGKYTIRRRRERIRGTRYVTNTYRNAVRRAVTKANKARADAAKKAGRPEPPPIPHWHPHQLRHLRTEQVKRAGGLEAARAYLGHSSVRTTEIYDSRDMELAKEIAWAIG